MSTAAPAVTHIEIPHFANHALYEGAVAWDACGPVAGEVALAALTGRTPDAGLAKEARSRDLAAHRFTVGSGQPLSDIAWDLGQRGAHNLEIIGFSETPDLNALHDLLKRGALAGHPVILQVSRAYHLPDNEAGVNYHFVVAGGIDSARGYLIANGDTRTAIARQALYAHWPFCSNVPTNWATWSTLVAAGLCGAILVKPNDAPPSPPPSPAPTPEPAAQPAQQAAVSASQVAQAVALAEQVSSTVQQLQAALKAL